MLIDFLLSLLAGGVVTGAQSRCVPKPLRIALAVLITLFMLTVGGFMLVCSIGINGSVAVRLVCGGLAALCFGYLVFFIRRVWFRMR